MVSSPTSTCASEPLDLYMPSLPLFFAPDAPETLAPKLLVSPTAHEAIGPADAQWRSRPRASPRQWAGAAHALDPPRHRGFQQLRERHLQARRQGVQHGQSRIGPTRLDAAQVSPKNATALGQFVLCEAFEGAQFLDAQAQGQLWGERFERHPTSVDLVYSFIHTLIRTLTI